MKFAISDFKLIYFTAIDFRVCDEKSIFQGATSNRFAALNEFSFSFRLFLLNENFRAPIKSHRAHGSKFKAITFDFPPTLLSKLFCGVLLLSLELRVVEQENRIDSPRKLPMK